MKQNLLTIVFGVFCLCVGAIITVIISEAFGIEDNIIANLQAVGNAVAFFTLGEYVW